MYLLLIFSIFSTVSGITPLYYEDSIVEYFNSDVVKQAIEIWEKYAAALENAISVALKENYGFKDMNLYVRKSANPLFVGKGYYHTDNQVHLVLHDMNLDDFPHLSDPLVQFPLLWNVIKLEAVVARINIRANYIQFRNTSNIAFDIADQNSYKMSPFLFKQVRSVGQLAITVEGCKLSGIGITSLNGRSVSLGYTDFRLLDCHFNFEIFTPGLASPPVVADYLPNSEGLHLEKLIMKPLQAELVPKLQAMLLTYINTSSIFKESLGEIRDRQSVVFEQITNYVNNVVRNLNALTITKNMGKVDMEDFSIYFNDTFDEGEVESVVNLRNMIITGLETVYTTHSGGPFMLPTLKLSERLRYGTIQVRGSIDMQTGENTKGMYDFAVEINDVEVDLIANIGSKSEKDNNPTRSTHTIEIMGWRSAQFSCPGMSYRIGEAFIIGYLQTKLPIYLTNHLNLLLQQAVSETDKDYTNLDKLPLGSSVPNKELNGIQTDENQSEELNSEITPEYYNNNEDENNSEYIANDNGDENSSDDTNDNKNQDKEIPATLEAETGEGKTGSVYKDYGDSANEYVNEVYDDIANEDSYIENGDASNGHVEEYNPTLPEGKVIKIKPRKYSNKEPDGSISDDQVAPDEEQLQAKFFDENGFVKAQNHVQSDN